MSKKKWKSERGAAPIIEMILIFPLVILAVGTLFYMGSFILQSVMIYNDAQRIAMLASKEAAIQGYEKLYGEEGMTIQADFNWEQGKVPGIELINAIMDEPIKPYRYITNDFLSGSKKQNLEENLEKLATDGSLLYQTDIDCTINTKNYIISQQVIVNVKKSVATNKVMQFFGIDEIVVMDVTATAVVGNPAEFVRNTDIVFDLVEFAMDNLKIGKSGQTANEKVKIFGQKFKDAKARLQGAAK